TSPARCLPSPRRRRRRASRTRSPTTRSCGGCSRRFSGGSSIRSPRCGRSLERCSGLATRTAPQLPDIEQARARLEGIARVTPVSKIDATKNYGARAELAGARFEDALAAANEYVEATGATFVHPFEDPVVIAGQGTIGLELAEQVSEVETVVIPIGGDGLASGISLALRAVKPGVRIIGVQAEGTLPGGSGYTIADGIAVKQPGELTMSILGDVLDDMISVRDDEISE